MGEHRGSKLGVVPRAARPGTGIRLRLSRPAQPAAVPGRRVFALVSSLVITALAATVYRTDGGGLIPAPWLAVGPLLVSLMLPPRTTAMPAGWAMLLGTALIVHQPARPGTLASHLGVLVLLAAFAVANSALRTAAQRRLSQARAVARVAQSAVLREVPATVAAGRLAARYGTSPPRPGHGSAGTCLRSFPRETTLAGSSEIRAVKDSRPSAWPASR